MVEVAGERVRFTHPLLAATHYSNAHPARRRELHRLLAEVLDDEEERAYHSARGAEAPDREIAVRIELAAQAAARRGAPETGAELLEQAARLTPLDTAEARRSRMISAAELHEASGDATRARELLEEVLPDVPHGPIRARALLQLAGTRTDDHAVAQALLEEALDEAGNHHRLRTEIELTLADHSAFLLSSRRHSIMVARHWNPPNARTIPDFSRQPRLGTRPTCSCVARGSTSSKCVSGIELEESTGIATTYRPSVMLAQILFWSDDYAKARPALERVIQLVKARGELTMTSFLVLHLALLDWYEGNAEAAERHRLVSAELDRDEGNHDQDLLHMWVEGLFAAGRGEFGRARRLAVSALELAEETGNPLFAGTPATVLACVDLWTGQPAAAHDRLGTMRDSFVSTGFGFMGSLWLGLWAVDVEALIALGRLDEAQVVSDDLLERAPRSENPNAVAVAERCRGLLLGARGEVGAGIEAMQKALAAHERRRLEPEVARTLLELGTSAAAREAEACGEGESRGALAIFEPIGAAMWVARARDELARVGLRRAVASEGLTPAQARVAELVAAGMSNREIASALYMSLRSVEAHLTKVYREYGVKSRGQLLASLVATANESDKERPSSETV